eukprot:Rmarinus@m.2724
MKPLILALALIIAATCRFSLVSLLYLRFLWQFLELAFFFPHGPHHFAMARQVATPVVSFSKAYAGAQVFFILLSSIIGPLDDDGIADAICGSIGFDSFSDAGMSVIFPELFVWYASGNYVSDQMVGSFQPFAEKTALVFDGLFKSEYAVLVDLLLVAACSPTIFGCVYVALFHVRLIRWASIIGEDTWTRSLKFWRLLYQTIQVHFVMVHFTTFEIFTRFATPNDLSEDIWRIFGQNYTSSASGGFAYFLLWFGFFGVSKRYHQLEMDYHCLPPYLVTLTPKDDDRDIYSFLEEFSEGDSDESGPLTDEESEMVPLPPAGEDASAPVDKEIKNTASKSMEGAVNSHDGADESTPPLTSRNGSESSRVGFPEQDTGHAKDSHSKHDEVRGKETTDDVTEFPECVPSAKAAWAETPQATSRKPDDEQEALVQMLKRKARRYVRALQKRVRRYLKRVLKMLYKIFRFFWKRAKVFPFRVLLKRYGGFLAPFTAILWATRFWGYLGWPFLVMAIVNFRYAGSVWVHQWMWFAAALCAAVASLSYASTLVVVGVDDAEEFLTELGLARDGVSDGAKCIEQAIYGYILALVWFMRVKLPNMPMTDVSDLVKELQDDAEEDANDPDPDEDDLANQPLLTGDHEGRRKHLLPLEETTAAMPPLPPTKTVSARSAGKDGAELPWWRTKELDHWLDIMDAKLAVVLKNLSQVTALIMMYAVSVSYGDGMHATYMIFALTYMASRAAPKVNLKIEIPAHLPVKLDLPQNISNLNIPNLPKGMSIRNLNIPQFSQSSSSGGADDKGTANSNSTRSSGEGVVVPPPAESAIPPSGAVVRKLSEDGGTWTKEDRKESPQFWEVVWRWMAIYSGVHILGIYTFSLTCFEPLRGTVTDTIGLSMNGGPWDSISAQLVIFYAVWTRFLATAFVDRMHDELEADKRRQEEKKAEEENAKKATSEGGRKVASSASVSTSAATAAAAKTFDDGGAGAITNSDSPFSSIVPTIVPLNKLSSLPERSSGVTPSHSGESSRSGVVFEQLPAAVMDGDAPPVDKFLETFRGVILALTFFLLVDLALMVPVSVLGFPNLLMAAYGTWVVTIFHKAPMPWRVTGMYLAFCLAVRYATGLSLVYDYLKDVDFGDGSDFETMGLISDKHPQQMFLIMCIVTFFFVLFHTEGTQLHLHQVVVSGFPRAALVRIDEFLSSVQSKLESFLPEHGENITVVMRFILAFSKIDFLGFFLLLHIPITVLLIKRDATLHTFWAFTLVLFQVVLFAEFILQFPKSDDLATDNARWFGMQKYEEDVTVLVEDDSDPAASAGATVWDDLAESTEEVYQTSGDGAEQGRSLLETTSILRTCAVPVVVWFHFLVARISLSGEGVDFMTLRDIRQQTADAIPVKNLKGLHKKVAGTLPFGQIEKLSQRLRGSSVERADLSPDSSANPDDDDDGGFFSPVRLRTETYQTETSGYSSARSGYKSVDQSTVGSSSDDSDVERRLVVHATRRQLEVPLHIQMRDGRRWVKLAPRAWMFHLCFLFLLICSVNHANLFALVYVGIAYYCLTKEKVDIALQWKNFVLFAAGVIAFAYLMNLGPPPSTNVDWSDFDPKLGSWLGILYNSPFQVTADFFLICFAVVQLNYFHEELREYWLYEGYLSRLSRNCPPLPLVPGRGDFTQTRMFPLNLSLKKARYVIFRYGPTLCAVFVLFISILGIEVGPVDSPTGGIIRTDVIVLYYMFVSLRMILRPMCPPTKYWAQMRKVSLAALALKALWQFPYLPTDGGGMDIDALLGMLRRPAAGDPDTDKAVGARDVMVFVVASIASHLMSMREMNFVADYHRRRAAEVADHGWMLVLEEDQRTVVRMREVQAEMEVMRARLEELRQTFTNKAPQEHGDLDLLQPQGEECFEGSLDGPMRSIGQSDLAKHSPLAQSGQALDGLVSVSATARTEELADGTPIPPGDSGAVRVATAVGDQPASSGPPRRPRARRHSATSQHSDSSSDDEGDGDYRHRDHPPNSLRQRRHGSRSARAARPAEDFSPQRQRRARSFTAEIATMNRSPQDVPGRSASAEPPKQSFMDSMGATFGGIINDVKRATLGIEDEMPPSSRRASLVVPLSPSQELELQEATRKARRKRRLKMIRKKKRQAEAAMDGIPPSSVVTSSSSGEERGGRHSRKVPKLALPLASADGTALADEGKGKSTRRSQTPEQRSYRTHTGRSVDDASAGPPPPTVPLDDRAAAVEGEGRDGAATRKAELRRVVLMLTNMGNLSPDAEDALPAGKAQDENGPTRTAEADSAESSSRTTKRSSQSVVLDVLESDESSEESEYSPEADTLLNRMKDSLLRIWWLVHHNVVVFSKVPILYDDPLMIGLHAHYLQDAISATEEEIRASKERKANPDSDSDDSDFWDASARHPPGTSPKKKSSIRTRPIFKILRMIYGLCRWAWHAVVAIHIPGFFFLSVVISGSEANLLSLPYAGLVLCWGLFYERRPTNTFWTAFLYYIVFVILLKSVFQMSLLCVCYGPLDEVSYTGGPACDSLECKYDQIGEKRVYIDGVVGLRKASYDGSLGLLNYLLPDICLLMGCLFVRHVLIDTGLWHVNRYMHRDMKAPPELLQELGIKAEDVEAANRDPPMWGILAKIREFRESAENEVQQKRSFRMKQEELRRQTELRAAERSGGKKKKKKPPPSPKKQQVGEEVDPDMTTRLRVLRVVDEIVTLYWTIVCKQRPGVDVYSSGFFIDLAIMLLLMFQTDIPMGENTGSSFFDAIESDYISGTFVLSLIYHFILIVLDRMAYLYRSVGWKLIQHFLSTIVLAYLFVLWPLNQDVYMSDVRSLEFLLVLKCAALVVSGYQISRGYTPLRSRPFLTKNTSPFTKVLFIIYRGVPFVMELRIVIDFACTRTTLYLNEWIKLEELYARAFTRKLDLVDKEANLRERGTPIFKKQKYLAFFIAFMIAFILWLPLLVFSSLNPTKDGELVTAASLSMRFDGYSPFYSTGSPAELSSFSSQEFDGYVRNVSGISNSDSKYAQRVVFYDTSEDVWTISPPAWSTLYQRLADEYDLHIIIDYKFWREQSNGKLYTNSHSEEILLTQTQKQHILEMMDGRRSNATMEDALPKFMFLSLSGKCEDMAPSERLDLVLHLMYTGTSFNWWVISQEPYDEVLFGDIEIRDDGDAFAPGGGSGVSPDDFQIAGGPALCSVCDRLLIGGIQLGSGGIVALYTGIVLYFGKFLRSWMLDSAFEFIYSDMPFVDDILARCSDLILARGIGDLELEESLYEDLINLYRSPEALLRYTGQYRHL